MLDIRQITEVKQLRAWMLLLVLFITAGSGRLQGQEIKFTASAPAIVELGEQFRLVFSVNKKAKNFISPGLENFSVLMGPSTSYSQSTSIINGKLTQNISYTYTYILQAQSEGEFTIAPAELSVNGKKYRSQEIKIKVVRGKSTAGSPGQSTQGSGQVAGGGKDLFVKLIVDKHEIYRGDRITATIKIYSRVNLSGFEDVKVPDFAGFMREDIETPALRSLERESVNGQIYGTGVLSRFVLFPQKSGELVIDPVEITALVQQRLSQKSNNFFDDFFDSYQTVRRNIVSPKVTIKVKPLPPGAPSSFKGAVGSYRLEATLDKNELKTNEALNLKIKISGNGNVKLLQAPDVDLPPDFELYDPKVSSSIKSDMSGTSGYKSFNFLMIPRYAGSYTIAPVSFAYFDPKAGKYKSLRSGEFSLEVLRGENDQAVSMISSPSKEDVKFIGKDIRFIHSAYIKLVKTDSSIWDNLWFILLYPVFLALFIAVYLMRRRMRIEQADVMLAKNRKASRIAKKRLKKAAVHLKNNNEAAFYEEILKTLWGYLGDKLGIMVSELTRDNIASELEKHAIEKEMQLLFTQLLDACEYAQYAPSGSTMTMEEVYKNATKMIMKLEHKLK